MRRFFLFSFLVLGFVSLDGQDAVNRDLQRAMQNADSYFYYDEDYEKAAALYEPLLKDNPGNHNLAAKLGICYLNIDGKKGDALRLLLKASENVSGSAGEYKKAGEKAPVDTYLYLAIAYHQNDSLEKALALFTDLKKKMTGTETFQEDYIDLQIRNCRYAIETKKRPLRIVSELFAPWLAEFPGAMNPVLSSNDSVFVFTHKNGGITQIYCSYKKNNVWPEPSNITQQLGGYDRFYTNSISGNGRTLILFMDDGGDGNLYYCQRKDTTWSRIKSVGRFINSIYWESHGFITPDGKTLYFSSNRPGGEGELDIWTSQKNEDGIWDRPMNCGNVINTPYDEDTPFFDPDNNALIFSSAGHISMGGYDVFRSISRAGGWTQPVGMPYAFNNVLENTNFILNNNAPGFIASRYNDKIDANNIYAIVAVDPADEITKASGTITLDDGLRVNPAIARVSVRNTRTGTIVNNILVAEDGTFNFDLKPGDYQIITSHDGYHTDTININLPLYFSGAFIPVNTSLAPEKVVAGEFLSIKNILFELESFKLDADAISTLEQLKNILITHPELKIEVAGYTDATGSTSYNMKLADRRAQAVIDYFTSSGIEQGRFARKAFGESNFAAINTNKDGTDNPEGRKYNRRVTFGIIDPQTGVIIRHEPFIPVHLRSQYSLKYSIVLLKSEQKLPTGYFSKIIRDETLFIRPVEGENTTLYTLGVFFNNPDAVTYLGYVRENGFKDAYIVNQYDLDNVSESELRVRTVETPAPSKRVFTIQLKATKNPVDISKVFPGYEGVKEIKADDGFFKYYFGEFTSFTKAKEALVPVLKEFNDAFIREIEVPVEK